jgi:RNA polymerase sigma-70 factor (ECF subfamily)
MPLDLSALFLTHRARVYRWALGLCGRHEDALDLTQEAFVRLVRSGPDSQDAAACAAWLRQTVARLAIDRWRANAARRERETAASRSPDTETAAGGVSPEAAGRIRVALAGLSDRQRLVLLCKCYDDMTFTEIASELGISEATVKTHYLRGLAALREQLGTLAEAELTP